MLATTKLPDIDETWIANGTCYSTSTAQREASFTLNDTVSVNAGCADCLLDSVSVVYGNVNHASDNHGAGVFSYGKASLSNAVIEHNTLPYGGSAAYNNVAFGTL